MTKKYWQASYRWADIGYEFSLQAEFARDLLRQNGILMGERGREDSTGRACLDVMPPKDLVKRAFTIAEIFIKEAEDKGYIRRCEISIEEASAFMGEMERLKHGSMGSNALKEALDRMQRQREKEGSET